MHFLRRIFAATIHRTDRCLISAICRDRKQYSVVFLALSLAALHVGAMQDSASCFRDGEWAYDSGDYALAIEHFEVCIRADPQRSIYHHRLGKSYGRLAEESNWMTAIGLAKRTGSAFEKAVSLDETNFEATMDLIRFYDEAPGFLGGGQDKAKHMRERLQALCDEPVHRENSVCIEVRVSTTQ